jgi:predicted dehydrogenase
MDNVKFGILGCGHIANKFCQALNKLEIPIHAVASRDITKAESFKKQYKAKVAYDNYDALVNDPEVKAIYIATPHGLHYEHLKLCIQAQKNVICEKAFTLNAKQAKEIFSLAIANNVLVMEALWTRFLDSINYVKSVVKREDILRIVASFGFPGNLSPDNRLINKSLGGGALLDVGIYPITFANIFLGKPNHIQAKATLSDNGVDLEDEFVLFYENNVEAQLKCSIVNELENFGIIYLKDGSKIEMPNFWSGEQVNDIPFPFKYNGFENQIVSFIESLNNGLLENPIMPHIETISVLQQMDAIRKHVGVIYECDN